MFENVTPPKDIFEGVEVAPPPATPPPIMDAAPAEPGLSRRFPWKPVVIAFAAVFIVGVAGTLSYFLIASREPAVPEEPVVPQTVVPEEPEEPEPQAPPASVVPPVVPEPEPDRDRDGLSDVEEAELGTSPTSSDTDADGLFDKEEAQTYDTDPLDPDTDNDGYQDGAEVKGGYNPKGSGKLFEIPE